MKLDLSPKLCDIIIPTKNRSRLLNRLITSIYNSPSFREDLFNIIVSDNNSTDDTDLVLNKFISRNNFFFKKQQIDLKGWENAYDLIELSKSNFVLIFSDHVLIEDEFFFAKILQSLNVNIDLYYIPSVEKAFRGNSVKSFSQINFFQQLFTSKRFYFMSGQIISKSLLVQKSEFLRHNAYLFFYFFILNLNNRKNILRINTFFKYESFKMKNRSWNYGNDGLLLDKLTLINKLKDKSIRFLFIWKLLCESKSVIPHIGLVNYKRTLKSIESRIGLVFYYYFSIIFCLKSKIKTLIHGIK